MRNRFYNFMQGRYGVDSFSRFLLGVEIVLVIISFFVRSNLLTILILALIVYLYFRIFSRNYVKRSAENEKFLELTAGLRSSARRISGQQKNSQQKTHTKKSKEYRYFKCPACSQQVRVPRGKGKIEIDCPRCHTKFIKRS